MDLGTRRAALDDFYALLAELEEKVGGKRTLESCNGRMNWPQRGVYFFFEEGEYREDAMTPRVVRVGTHALGPSRSTLWGRLSQHRGTDDGSTPGGGNHRGSIFRRHVGAALLSGDDWPEPLLHSWGQGSTSNRVVREQEYPLELAVSNHIRRMPFLWLGVEDAPTATSDRGVIETGAIGLLSNLDRDTVDPSSSRWLGALSDRRFIRASGLWNVNHVGDHADTRFLKVVEMWLEALRFPTVPSLAPRVTDEDRRRDYEAEPKLGNRI